jgi:hypothetical protein
MNLYAALRLNTMFLRKPIVDGLFRKSAGLQIEQRATHRTRRTSSDGIQRYRIGAVE